MDLREKAPLFPGRCVLPCKACLSISGSWDLRVLPRSHISSAGCPYVPSSPGYLVMSPRAGDVILEETGAWKFLIRKGQGWNGRRGGSGVGGREASLVFSLVRVHRPGLLLGGFAQVTVAIHLPALERLLCSALGPLSPNPQTHSSMCFPPQRAALAEGVAGSPAPWGEAGGPGNGGIDLGSHLPETDLPMLGQPRVNITGPLPPRA